MGCSHNCAYCDGRAEKYHFEGDFTKDIKIKSNIVDELENFIPKLRENSPFHISSGISDAYQSLEKKNNITGRCSEILSNYDFHVSVLTKSSLILRDLENWKKVNNRGGFTLQMSLNTLDDSIRKKMEPGASSVQERLETIKTFKEAGCNVGVFMMPLLPGITDTEENINQLLEKLTELKVDYIMPGPLTLRPGRQKDLYMEKVDKYYPHLSKEYADIYSENKISGMPNKSYYYDFNKRVEKAFQNITSLPPHYLYKNTMPLYCELNMLLEHMILLYSWKNMDVTNLKKAYKQIHEYLLKEKKNFNKKRSLPSNHIDTNLKFLLQTDSFNNIVDNTKLIDFIKKVVIERKTFDYKTLKLI